MVREMITLQVGQCGNQIGRRFWATLLHEKAAEAKADGKYDAAMSAFFRNVDGRYEPALDLDIGTPLASLRARAILVDTEEGVVAETLRDPVFGELFDATQLVTDVSGAGNNWAHGHAVYGPQYGGEIDDAVRTELERCDSPQSFFVLHSMGGGTGSGLGSYLMEQLHDTYPELCRFSVAIYPSADDDVITSPYNAVLATQSLTHYADCVVPMENAALLDVARRANDLVDRAAGAKPPAAKSKAQGFDEVNDVAAHLLSHLTAGARFSGALNIDVNELATNLVPFPKMHYLTAGYAPVLPGHQRKSVLDVRDARDVAQSTRQVQRLFAEACSPLRRVVRAPEVATRSEVHLACALLGRGDVVASDVNCAIERLKTTMRMPRWNPDGFKVGLCSAPPLAAPRAVLCLQNATSISSTFSALRDRFHLLYRRKAMLHHYTQYVDAERFDDALNDLDELIESYAEAQRNCA